MSTEKRADRYGLSISEAADHPKMEKHLQRASLAEFKVAKHAGVSPPAKGRRMQQTGRPNSNEAHYLVWVDGKPAGAAGCFPDGRVNQPGEAYAYVFPPHRGHGLGRFLVRWLLGQGMDVNKQSYSAGGLATTDSMLDQIFAIEDSGESQDEPTRAPLKLVRRSGVEPESDDPF